MIYRRSACLSVLAVLLALAACYPAAPGGLEYQVLDLEATAAVITAQAYQTQQAAIEATRSAGEELARREQAAQAEIDLINRRAEAEGTALAGRVTDQAILEKQIELTQAPQQTAYALALTEPARAATAQAINNVAMQERDRMRSEAIRSDAITTLVQMLPWICLVSVAGLFALVWVLAMRRTAVHENGNGSVVIHRGLYDPQVAMARRDLLPAQTEPPRYISYNNGTYLVGPDGRRWYSEDSLAGPEDEADEEVIDADFHEPQAPPPAAPLYYQEWPADSRERALLLVRASLEVIARDPAPGGVPRSPYHVVGSRELESFRAAGVKWSGMRWQNTVYWLEAAGWLAPGDGTSARRVIDQVHTLDQLEQYLASGRPVPPPIETF